MNVAPLSNSNQESCVNLGNSVDKIESSRHSEIEFDEIKITDTQSIVTPIRLIKMDSLVRETP